MRKCFSLQLHITIIVQFQTQREETVDDFLFFIIIFPYFYYLWKTQTVVLAVFTFKPWYDE